jgi:hypothetical protein
MQDFDTTAQDSESCSASELRLQQVREYWRFIFKRMIVFVCFGPGVLGCLWLIGRILKR